MGLALDGKRFKAIKALPLPRHMSWMSPLEYIALDGSRKRPNNGHLAGHLASGPLPTLFLSRFIFFTETGFQTCFSWSGGNSSVNYYKKYQSHLMEMDFTTLHKGYSYCFKFAFFPKTKTIMRTRLKLVILKYQWDSSNKNTNEGDLTNSISYWV